MILDLANHPAFLLALLVAGVLAGILLIGRAQRFVPRGSRAEGWLERWGAVLQALVVGLGLLGTIHLVYRGDAPTWRWLTVGFFFLAFWANRRALTDWATGILLRAEGTLRTGERLGLHDARGRISRLGLRSAEVEAEDGRLLRIPYSRLADTELEVSPREVAARSHTFTMDVAGGADAVALVGHITSEALLSPWSAAHPPPSARVLDRGEAGARLEVTVYPIDATWASVLEEAVRRSVPDSR